MNTYLITGGSGFIGTNLIERLRSNRPTARIVSADAVPPRIAEHEEYWRPIDLTDRDNVIEVVRQTRPTHVVHLGARTDLRGKTLSDYSANTIGVQGMVAGLSSLELAPEQVIYASSRLVCRIGYVPVGDDDYCPPNAYGASKVEGERIVRSGASGNWVILRPTSIWGPWFDVPYRDFFDSVVGGRYVNLGKKPLKKSFGYVGNTVHQIDCVLHAPYEGAAGRTLYLGDYPPIEVRDFARRIRLANGQRELPTLPASLLRPVAKVGDLLQSLGWERAPLTTFRLNNLLTPMIYDLAGIEQIVGPLPYTLDDGIRETLRWMSEQRS